jgi:hypothetical protein
MRPHEQRARARLEQLEKQRGRTYTQADCELVLDRLSSTPAELTEADFSILGYFRGERAEVEARAARERVINPPPAVPPSAVAPPQQQLTMIKRVIRDAAGKIEGVYEDVVPLMAGGVAAVPAAFEARLDEVIKAQDAARLDVVTQANQAFVNVGQAIEALKQRTTELEAHVATLEREKR